jgi:hypothetical protein
MGFLSSVIGGVTSLFGGNDAKKAAKEQSKSNAATLKKQIEQVAPFRDAGIAAINPLKDATGIGDNNAAAARFKASPEYTLNYDNMLADSRDDVTAFGAGSGNLFSGGTLKALQDRAGRLTNQLFGNYTNNLFKLSGMGANAAAGVASNMGDAENRNQNAIANQGNASVAQTLGIGQAAQGAVKGFENIFGGKQSSFSNPDFSRLW